MVNWGSEELSDLLMVAKEVCGGGGNWTQIFWVPAPALITRISFSLLQWLFQLWKPPLPPHPCSPNITAALLKVAFVLRNYVFLLTQFRNFWRTGKKFYFAIHSYACEANPDNFHTDLLLGSIYNRGTALPHYPVNILQPWPDTSREERLVWPLSPLNMSLISAGRSRNYQVIPTVTWLLWRIPVH